MYISQLSKKRYREILTRLKKLGLHENLPKTKNVKAIATKHGELILVDDEPVIIHVQNLYIPFIKALEKFSGFKKVYVDEGAVKFLTNGADVMRPGIIRWDIFKKGEIIAIYVETYNIPILIGQAIVNSDDFTLIKKGKVIINLHYVGDEFWRLSRQYSS